MHVVQQGKVGGRVEALALLEQAFPTSKLFDELMALLCQLYLAHLLVDSEVAFRRPPHVSWRSCGTSG
jgi:hypothetical protein